MKRLERSLLWVGWWLVAWSRGHLPPWNEAISMFTGEPRRYPTPEELLSRAKASGVGTFSGPAVLEEAARG